MVNDYKTETFIYNDDDHKIQNKSYINFVGIPNLCIYYTKHVPFNNKLHKYIYKSCPVKSQKFDLLVL